MSFDDDPTPRLLDSSGDHTIAPDDTPVLRLSGPGDLVALVPHQLGFHPARSIVLAGMHDRRLGALQRLDIPQPEDAEEAAARLVRVLVREGCTRALVIAYEDIPGESGEVVDVLADECALWRVEIVDVVLVRDGEFRSTLGRGPWQPLPVALGPDGARLLGPRHARPLPTRHDLVCALRGGDEDDPVRERVVEALAVLRRTEPRPLPRLDADPKRAASVELRGRGVAVWRRVLDPDDVDLVDLPADVLALAGACLLDRELRDGLIGWLCPGTVTLASLAPSVRRPLTTVLGAADSPVRDVPTPDRLEVVLHRVARLGRIVAPEHAASVRTLLASVAWHHGHGAMASIAIEIALADDPSLRLARLMANVIAFGIRTDTPRIDRCGDLEPNDGSAGWDEDLRDEMLTEADVLDGRFGAGEDYGGHAQGW